MTPRITGYWLEIAVPVVIKDSLGKPLLTADEIAKKAYAAIYRSTKNMEIDRSVRTATLSGHEAFRWQVADYATARRQIADIKVRLADYHQADKNVRFTVAEIFEETPKVTISELSVEEKNRRREEILQRIIPCDNRDSTENQPEDAKMAGCGLKE